MWAVERSSVRRAGTAILLGGLSGCHLLRCCFLTVVLLYVLVDAVVFSHTVASLKRAVALHLVCFMAKLFLMRSWRVGCFVHFLRLCWELLSSCVSHLFRVTCV